MSIYIGKSNSNNNLLHITKGTNSESDMKNGTILSDTIYNSNYGLSSYRLIPLTLGISRPYNQIYGYTSGFAYALINTFLVGWDLGNNTQYCPVTGIQGYTMDSGDYSYLINALHTIPGRILFLGSDKKILDGIGIANIVSMVSYEGTYGQQFSSTLSTSYGFGIAYFQFVPPPIVYYILVIEDNFYPSLSGSIKIDTTGIYIGYENVFSNKNLVTSSYNPGSIQVSEDLYLTNTTSGGISGLELATYPNISIKIDSIEIFNSLYNSFLPLKSTSFQTITKSILYSINYVDTLLYSMSSSESYCVIGLTVDYGGAGGRITTAYAIVTRVSNRSAILSVKRNTSSAPSLRMDFTIVYANNGNVYIRTLRAGGSAGSSSYDISFIVNSF